MSVARIQFRPGMGHQWRKVRLRRPRCGGRRSKGAPEECFGGFGEGRPGVFGEAPDGRLDGFALCELYHKTHCLVNPL